MVLPANKEGAEFEIATEAQSEAGLIDHDLGRGPFERIQSPSLRLAVNLRRIYSFPGLLNSVSGTVWMTHSSPSSPPIRVIRSPPPSSSSTANGVIKWTTGTTPKLDKFLDWNELFCNELLRQENRRRLFKHLLKEAWVFANGLTHNQGMTWHDAEGHRGPGPTAVRTCGSLPDHLRQFFMPPLLRDPVDSSMTSKPRRRASARYFSTASAPYRKTYSIHPPVET